MISIMMPIIVNVSGKRTSALEFGSIDAGQKRCPQTLQRERDATAIAPMTGEKNKNKTDRPRKTKDKAPKNVRAAEIRPKQLTTKLTNPSTANIRNPKKSIILIFFQIFMASPPHEGQNNSVPISLLLHGVELSVDSSVINLSPSFIPINLVIFPLSTNEYFIIFIIMCQILSGNSHAKKCLGFNRILS